MGCHVLSMSFSDIVSGLALSNIQHHHHHHHHHHRLPHSHQVWTHPELGHCLQLPSSLCPVLQACQTIKPPATCQCRCAILTSPSSSLTWDEHRQSAKGPCQSTFRGKPFCYVETPSSCPDLAKSSRWLLCILNMTIAMTMMTTEITMTMAEMNMLQCREMRT